uniref:Uncharacterized protein n=1 Tax=candidate division CPR3 bacterium TaxID=2268181 RepID=A0A7C4M071_UNCC3
METANINLLITILSVGFVILIIFVCVAIGAIIRIMLDVKKITEIGKREAENIAKTMDKMGDKAKNFLVNSMVLEKIIPAILGAITVGMGAKKMADSYGFGCDCEDSGTVRTKKAKDKKTSRRGSKIFVEDEID